MLSNKILGYACPLSGRGALYGRRGLSVRVSASDRSIKSAAGAVSSGESHAHAMLDALPLAEVIGALPDYILVVDRSLRIVVANRYMAGHTPQALAGMHVSNVFPAHLHSEAMGALQRVLASGESQSFQAEFVVPASQARHFNMRVHAVRRDGHVVAATMSATEVTDQVMAEQAIATQARMIESMLEGVAVIDEGGVIEITNPAFDALFGHPRGALIGRHMHELAGWPFQSPERWRSAEARATDSVTVEFDGRRSDDTLFAASGVLSRFDVGDRQRTLLVLQDVSERKQLERAILEAVNREQYRIGNDLHDGLGQELTGIALMLRGVAGRLSTEYPPMLADMESITRLVNNAIESTRSLARGLSPVSLERGGLGDALEGLAMHAGELYGVPTQFSQRLRSQRPLGAEVANHLYRIAQEAVSNAVRHGHARSIRVHLSSAGAKVSLAITDDGRGLPERALEAPGLGLKIMRYRARILGGEVRFERMEPCGTRVVCDCPLAPPGKATVRSKRVAAS